jgi:hypothetical protein
MTSLVMELDEDERQIVATALVYAMQILAHMPAHQVRPPLFEMDRLLNALVEDEKQRKHARQVAGSHVAQMLGTRRKQQQ